MEFQSATIGLSLIIIAWILQLIYSWDGNREIKKRCLIFYSLGTAWLVVDSFINNMNAVAIFNLIILVIVCFLLIKIGAERKIEKSSRRTVRKKKR